MLEKIKALMSLFKQGQAVADPAKWKAHQITVTMLGGLIIAIVQAAKAFGHEIPVDSSTASALAGGIIAGVNVILTLITSKSVGVPSGAVREAQPPVPANAEAAEQPAQVESEQTVSHVSEAPVVKQTIDDDTRRRAEEWVRQHSVQPNRFDNGLASDA